jgi:hypothetical protein
MYISVPKSMDGQCLSTGFVPGSCIVMTKDMNELHMKKKKRKDKDSAECTW